MLRSEPTTTTSSCDLVRISQPLYPSAFSSAEQELRDFHHKAAVKFNGTSSQFCVAAMMRSSVGDRGLYLGLPWAVHIKVKNLKDYYNSGKITYKCWHHKYNYMTNGIVHRDLKPENLLYATPAPDAPLKIAPEILRGCAYGPEVDMWSVGIITYILLCGFEPFYDERGDQFMFRRILNCEYYFISPWWDEVSLNAKDLVRKLIVLDPKKRLTTFQALQHPWVTGKAANFVHMDTAQKKLQEFNARRKLKAAVKAVVASSRLGSASSSHSSVQEGRASREPSPPQAGDEGVPGGEGPPGAAEEAGTELPEVQAGEEVSGDDGDPAPRMEPAALEEMEGTDPETEGHPAGETRATAGAAAAPGGREEDPALEVGAQQGDSVLPEN
ncbi:hypothetical protein FD754_005582 [Muntiacus muntjak]|uniref:Protein kinase domain-containing protein n=1 Tax=Muntiacus muntjak TaxID=9888 RepID=A0A5N3WMF3_MUNMU|nr:hypothetical protein FD754_005582 [Muntiacus muntjak]